MICAGSIYSALCKPALEYTYTIITERRVCIQNVKEESFTVTELAKIHAEHIWPNLDSGLGHVIPFYFNVINSFIYKYLFYNKEHLCL